MPRAARTIEVLAEAPIDRPLHWTTPIRRSPEEHQLQQSPACANRARRAPNTRRTAASRPAGTDDAYGPVTITVCSPGDVDLDGDVDLADLGQLKYYYGDACEQDLGPWLLDLKVDGVIDPQDAGLLKYYYTEDALQWAPRSGVGIRNPYFFTGRTLDIFYDNEAGIDLPLQDNRNRSYYPLIGRWMQRDPLMYVHGTNLYEYVASRPIQWGDPEGLIPIEVPPGMGDRQPRPKRPPRTGSSAGPWIAGSAAAWVQVGEPFVIAGFSCNLPTGGGWLGLIFTVAGELGAFEVKLGVPISDVYYTLNVSPYGVVGACCYCKFVMKQTCKKCITTAEQNGRDGYKFSYEWQEMQTVCRDHVTKARIRAVDAAGYRIYCPCKGPEGGDPSRSIPRGDAANDRRTWCCREDLDARCGCK
jgi:RHS repeat-associated protein